MDTIIAAVTFLCGGLMLGAVITGGEKDVWLRRGEDNAIRALVRQMMRHSAGRCTAEELTAVYRALVDKENEEAGHA